MSKGEGSSIASNLFHRGSAMDQGSLDDSYSSYKGGSASGFSNSPERTMSQSFSQTKTSKRESYKAQKKTYRSQKKEAAKELLSTITDPSVVLLGDWLKVRGTLKSWTKLWCVLKPGVLILYKSDKQKKSQWVGTILLNTCELLERPSKKDGFCFKLFHPLDQSIWATKGPKGETIGAFVQPLPYSYCIFRAPSEAAGKCWMDALELALKCTSLLKRSMTRLDTSSTEVPDMDTELTRKRVEFHQSKSAADAGSDDYHDGANGNDDVDTEQTGHQYDSMHLQESQMNESDLERHFANQDGSEQQDPHLSSKRASVWEAISDGLRGRNESEPFFKKPTADDLYYALLTLKIKNVRTETLKFELEIEQLQNELSKQNESQEPTARVVYKY